MSNSVTLFINPSLQSAFYSQFTTYEMILFYGGAVILTLITTSFTGLSQARPQIMGLTCLSFALEQATAQYGLFSLQVRRSLWFSGCVVKVSWCKESRRQSFQK